MRLDCWRRLHTGCNVRAKLLQRWGRNEVSRLTEKKGGHPGIGSNRCIAGQSWESFRAFGLAKASCKKKGAWRWGDRQPWDLKLLACRHLKQRLYPEVNREPLESFNQECDGTEFAF